MSITDARYRANTKYIQKNYEQLSIRLPRGEKEKIKGFATDTGLSLAQYIRQACYEKVGKVAPAMKKEK